MFFIYIIAFLEIETLKLITMIVSFISYKGGVGKTTSTQNTAVCLAHAGYKVCVLDADESTSSKDWIERRSAEMPKIDLIADNDEDNIGITIQELQQEYDFVLIDSPPSQKPISSIILLISDLVIVPLLPKGAQETNTIHQLMKKVHNLEATIGKEIMVRFIVNKYKDWVKSNLVFMEALKELYPNKVLDSTLGDRDEFSKVTHSGKGVYEGNDKKAKAEVIALSKEIINLG